MKFKLLSIVLLGLLSASCTMENVQTETSNAKQKVESYIVQAQDYISNLFWSLRFIVLSPARPDWESPSITPNILIVID